MPRRRGTRIMARKRGTRIMASRRDTRIMPRRFDTRIWFTIEQRWFAIKTLFEVQSLDDACQIFLETFGFEVPWRTMSRWISQFYVFLGRHELFDTSEE